MTKLERFEKEHGVRPHTVDQWKTASETFRTAPDTLTDVDLRLIDEYDLAQDAA
jgi:hypothetical protein